MSAAVASDGRTRGTIDLREPRQRILEATLRGIGRQGVAGLTVEAIARDAGCGRATVYRVFPGGREELLEAAALAELARFHAEVGERLDAAGDLAELLTTALWASARFVRDSAPLTHVLAHEPTALLAHVAFDKSPVVFAVGDALLAPRLARYLPADRVSEVAEWLARIVLSHLALRPEATGTGAPADLTDRDVADHLVRTFVLPGLDDVVAIPARP